MELTDGHKVRILAAYQRAVAEEAVAATYTPSALPIAKGAAKAAEGLAKVWFAMSEDDRAAVRAELAAICGAEPHALDVGLAAQRVVVASHGKRGPKVRDGGFNAAIAEAMTIWVEGGKSIQFGNIWRDSKPGQSYPMLDFVAGALKAALPEAARVRATGMKVPDDAKLWQSVDARLRA